MGFHTLLYIVQEKCSTWNILLGAGSGDNTFPTPPSIRLHYTIHYTPSPSLYVLTLHIPNPRNIFGTSPLPPSFINRSITFSYTLSTLSITISYSMVGVRWCATLLRGEFGHILIITLLSFFTCIISPSLPIVSLSSSINVLSIYSHFLFIRVWVIGSCCLYHSPPTPFHLFIPVPCIVPPSLLRAFSGDSC